tara:strand:+ start:981 stop:1232 length:252 start_codon:yes stop_codon:yes gene_type:complete
MKENKMKPTAREVKVILNSMGIELPFLTRIFNDKRKNGGRIKVWGVKVATENMFKLESMLQILFPSLEIKVEHLNRSTVVKFS